MTSHLAALCFDANDPLRLARFWARVLGWEMTDDPDAETLPDGHARRGISVVAALSEWRIHTNRRTGGSWTQRYEHGVPTTDLAPIADDGTTGTTVHFQPDTAILMNLGVMASELKHAASWPQLRIELVEERPS